MKVFVAVLVALCTLSLAPVPSHAQTWTPYAPVPSGGTGVEGMYGGTYDGFIIAAYGNDDVLGDTVTTRIYNVVNTCFGPADTWTTGPDAPDPVRAEGVGVVSGKYFYAIGGRGPVGVLDNLERFDARGDCLGGWATLTPMPTPRAGLAAAVVKNAIYAIGGRDSGGGPCSGTATAVVEKYNIGTGMWGAVAPLPSPRSDLAAIAPGDGKIYVFGGCNGDILAPFDLVNVYNPVTNTWSPDLGPGALAPMPTARSSLVVGKIKTRIYAIGGIDDTGNAIGTNEGFNYTATPPAWDPPLTWPDMPTPRGEAIAVSRSQAPVFNGIYVIGGGQPAFGNQVDDNEAFTIP